MKCQFIWASHECNLDIEQGTDLETLKCLALSLTPNFDAEEINLETLLFLDYCGREIDTDSDLEHIILENKPISPSSDTSSDNSDWYFTVWCTNKIQLTSPTCTRTMLQEQYIIQPTYRLIDTDFLFCSYCQQYVDSSLIVAETRSLTRFCCRYEEAVTVGLCQSLTSISGYHEHSQSNLHPLTINAHRVLFERALSTQSCYPQIIIQQRKRFDARLVSGSSTALSYENIQWQEQARAVIDYQALRLYAVEELVAEPTMAK